MTDRVESGSAAHRALPSAHAALDRVAALAADLLAMPSAQVSLSSDGQMAGEAGPPPGSAGPGGLLEDSLCTVTAALAAPLLVTDARCDARVSWLSLVTSGQVGACLGVPLLSGSDRAVGALCVYGPDRRAWSPSDVAVLERLAVFARSELEGAELEVAELEVAAWGRGLDDSRTRWDLMAEAADLGSFDWDLVTGELVGDERLVALFGYDEGDVAFDRTVASVEARTHPDDVARVDAAVSEARASVGPLHLVHRIVLPGGRTRWLEARGRALAGPDGTAARLIGVYWDTTQDQDDEARADRVLASMSLGYLAVDGDWRVRYVNDEGARILGFEGHELIGGCLWELFPHTVGSVFDETYRRVARTGRTESLEAYSAVPLDAWFEVRVVAEGGGVAIYFLDVTERRRSLELLQLSVDVSERMVGADSVDAAVAALAELVVPGLADWSIVTLIEADGRMRDIQSWHADPDLRPVVQRYVGHRLEEGGTGIMDRVVGTGAAVEVGEDLTGFGLRVLRSGVAREALRVLRPESAVAVPLLSGSKVVGVLTLVRNAGRPAMDPRELAVTDSLCRRAGLAVDNARMHSERAQAAARDRTVAQALQQALLTTLPEPESLWLAARYLTAEDGDQVGGDWYDAVVQPGGAVVVIIGDVVGHDITAAASMGQLRTMLRMLALAHESPSRILAGLDEAAHRLRLDTLATVVVASIGPVVGGAAGRTVRWSNAGHPPPILMHADGTTELLVDDQIDLMIGVEADTPRTEHRRQLPDASTIVFYTDGLVERRGDDLDAGIGRLERALQRHRDLDPQRLLDRVLAESIADRPGDDIAVLAVGLGGGPTAAPSG